MVLPAIPPARRKDSKLETITTKKIAVLEATMKFIEFLNRAEAKFIAERFPMLEPHTFYVDGGRKYLRIAMTAAGRGTRVHCFVDANTGSVYKAAGWKAPALNGERFNLLDADSVAHLEQVWDPYGGYLYK